MEREPRSQEVRTHRIAKVLSVLGIVLVVFGIIIGIVFPVSFMPAWETLSNIENPLRFEILIREGLNKA